MTYEYEAGDWVDAGYRTIPINPVHRNTVAGFTGKGAVPPNKWESLGWRKTHGHHGLGIVMNYEPDDALFLVVVDLDTEAGTRWLKVAESSRLGPLPEANMVVSSGNHGPPELYHHRYFLSETPVRGHGLAGLDIKASWGFVNAGGVPKPGGNPWVNYTDISCTTVLSRPRDVCCLPRLSPEWSKFLDESKDPSASTKQRQGTSQIVQRPWSSENVNDPIHRFNNDPNMTWNEVLDGYFEESDPGHFVHPEATNPKSAEIYEDEDCDRLCVWSPNAELGPGVYRKIDALAALKFDGKYGDACRWVRTEFYGQHLL